MTSYSPTEGVLTVLELLQARTAISGVELAERLEVDQRTVRRYITKLQDMGIPVESQRGRYGMYRLRAGTRVPPLLFREDEAFAMTLGLLTARKIGLTAAAPAVESALAKLERTLPAMLREHVRAVQETLIFDFELADTAPNSQIITTLCIAVQQGRRVQMLYSSWDGQQTERQLDPYGVVCRSGFWYTVGYCHLRSDLRTFRLDRMVQVELCEETFIAPAHFDAVGHVARSLATMPMTWQVDVLLETTLEEAQRLVSPALATLEQEGKGVALRCYVEHLDWIAHVLIGLRCPFIVRQPLELRTTLREVAATIVHMAERKL